MDSFQLFIGLFFAFFAKNGRGFRVPETMAALYSKVPMISNFRSIKKLRLEIIHMKYDMKQIGDRIRQLRMKRGLTQEKAAEALEIDRSFYSRIEAGKKGCSVDLFIQLSALYDVSLDYLILGRYFGSSTACKETAQLKEDIEQLVSSLERFKKVLYL